MKIKNYNNQPPVGAKQQEHYWKLIKEFSAAIGHTKEGFLDFQYNDETRNFIIRFVDGWIPFPFEYMVLKIISFSLYYHLYISLKYWRHILRIGWNFWTVSISSSRLFSRGGNRRSYLLTVSKELANLAIMVRMVSMMIWCVWSQFWSLRPHYWSKPSTRTCTILRRYCLRMHPYHKLFL